MQHWKLQGNQWSCLQMWSSTVSLIWNRIRSKTEMKICTCDILLDKANLYKDMTWRDLHWTMFSKLQETVNKLRMVTSLLIMTDLNFMTGSLDIVWGSVQTLKVSRWIGLRRVHHLLILFQAARGHYGDRREPHGRLRHRIIRFIECVCLFSPHLFPTDIWPIWSLAI